MAAINELVLARMRPGDAVLLPTASATTHRPGPAYQTACCRAGGPAGMFLFEQLLRLGPDPRAITTAMSTAQRLARPAAGHPRSIHRGAALPPSTHHHLRLGALNRLPSTSAGTGARPLLAAATGRRRRSTATAWRPRRDPQRRPGSRAPPGGSGGSWLIQPWPASPWR